MPNYIEVCINAAEAGGAVLLQKLGRVQATEKALGDLVTEADFASQREITDIILNAFPDHGILGEENLPQPSQAADPHFRWIIDPLDGTTNFVHQVPHFCVSVALQCGNDLLAAAVYNPINRECFTAQRGGGAFLDGRPIRTSSVARLSESLCAIGFPPGKNDADSPDMQAFLRALSECQSLRRTGSAALNLCYVACGRFDAAWSFSTRIWDSAAGALLVEEAGGRLTAPDRLGNWLQTGHFLAAATPELHAQLSTLLNQSG